MRVLTSLATAPMIEPSRAIAEPNMKNLQAIHVSLQLEHQEMADGYGGKKVTLPSPAKDVR